MRKSGNDDQYKFMVDLTGDDIVVTPLKKRREGKKTKQSTEQLIFGRGADKCKIRFNPVKITHTINIAGFNLKNGMNMVITDIFWDNGETQLMGYVDGRKEQERVPSMWTNVDYLY